MRRFSLECARWVLRGREGRAAREREGACFKRHLPAEERDEACDQKGRVKKGRVKKGREGGESEFSKETERRDKDIGCDMDRQKARKGEATQEERGRGDSRRTISLLSSPLGSGRPFRSTDYQYSKRDRIGAAFGLKAN